MLKTRLTLTPGANGTKKLQARYGDRLVCVRYRYDRERRKRFKTVELIEEEADWTPDGVIYLVEIAWEEADLRARAKRLGARWNPSRKLWEMSRETLTTLKLTPRIRGWIEPQ